MVTQLQAESLTIDVDYPERSETVRFHWRGRSNAQNPEKVLDPYLCGAVDACLDASSGIHMHFEELEYFNSSTLSSVIRFIRYAREKQVNVVLVYDGKRKWQKLGFDALRIFAKGEQLVFQEC